MRVFGMVNKIIAIFLRLKNKDQIIGGEDIRRYEVLRGTKEQGIQVEVYTLDMEPTDLSIPLINQRSILLRFPTILLKIIFPFIIFKHIVSAKRRGYKILMSQWPFAWDISNNVMGICSIFLSSKFLRMKIWCEIHDIPTMLPIRDNHHIKFSGLTFYMRKIINLLLEKLLLSASSYITSSSQGQLEYLRKRYNLAAKRAVLYAGIDPDDYRNIRRSRTRLRKGIEPYKVMYVGSYWDADLEMLLDSIQLLRQKGYDLELSIVSYNLPNKKAKPWVKFRQGKYVDFVKITNMHDVLVIPYVPYNNYPYLQITFQVKVPMYLASGKPVVIGRTKELENFFGQNTDLFLYSKPDVYSLSEKIESLILNQDLSKKISNKAFKYVSTHMTWNSNVKKALKEIELI